MNIFIVEKFLCCFKLEVCAYLMACFGLTMVTLSSLAIISFGIFGLINSGQVHVILAKYGFEFDGFIKSLLDFLLSSKKSKYNYENKFHGIK